MDLLDEVGIKQGAGTSSGAGGDLFDEAGIDVAAPPKEEWVAPEDYKDEYYRQMNESMSGMDEFFVGAGRGLTTIGRAVGLADPERPGERGAAEDLADNSLVATAGEVVGEAAPFMLAAPLAGGGLATSTGGRVLIPAAQKLLTRVGLSGILGMLEGSAIVAGKGGDTEQILKGGGTGGVIAGAAELIFPVLGRLGGAVFRKLKRTPSGPLLSKSGAPSKELMEALDEVNMTFDDLTDDAVEYLSQNQKKLKNPKMEARRSRFDDLDMEYTAGDISQDFRQQARESRLSSMAVEEGEPIRQLRLRQKSQWETKVNDMVDGLGVPAETGDSIKTALSGRLKGLKGQKNALYREIADAAPETNKIPVFTDDIADALPDADLIDDISITAPESTTAFRKSLARFGLDTSDAGTELLGKIEAQPLTVGNYERFRKLIGSIERSDTTGAIKVLTGPVKQALDGEMDRVGRALKGTHGVGDDLVDKAKQARKIVRKTKTEFSKESITGRLVGVKRDGVTPTVEASKVVRELATKPVEHLDRTIKSLVKAGDPGRKAIGDLRASVVLQALEDSMKAESRKGGFSGYAFAKSLKKFGDDKLDLLFGGDEKAMAQLKKLRQAAIDREPTNAAVPKGSAPINMDIAWSLASNSRVVQMVKHLADATVNAGKDGRSVKNAISASPQLKKIAPMIQAEFPVLAAAIGLSVTEGEQRRNNKQK